MLQICKIVRTRAVIPPRCYLNVFVVTSVFLSAAQGPSLRAAAPALQHLLRTAAPLTHFSTASESDGDHDDHSAPAPSLKQQEVSSAALHYGVLPSVSAGPHQMIMWMHAIVALTSSPGSTKCKELHLPILLLPI